MNIRCLIWMIATAPAWLSTTFFGQANDRSGLRCISSKAFPVRDGAKLLAECDFEGGAKSPEGWSQGGGEVVTEEGAPQGKAYVRLKAKKSAGVRSPVISAQPGKGCFLTFWVKTTVDPWTVINFTSDEREPSYTRVHTPIFYQDFPLNTAGEWKQEGFYFVMPPQCQSLEININPREDEADGQFVCLDDIRIQEVSDAEISAAYEAERSNYPSYDIPSRPGDGKNLALSVAKWEGRAGLPGKPFVIWALGSSFTDRQGDGYELVRAIRKRFPNAPPIIYRKHGGPGTPWEYVDGWIKQFVAYEEPDLIFTYTTGTLQGLESMLSDIRRLTTAEVIVPTLHFKPTSPMTAEDIENGAGVAWGSVRDICQRHGAEFVENRLEMAEYIAREHLVPDDLLADHNHQNMHGRIRIWDNVARHLLDSDQSTYTADSRERKIDVAPPVNTATEQLSATGRWSFGDGVLRTSAKDARLKVSFTGNQIDVMELQTPSGGTAKVFIDGIPSDEAAVFVTNFIKPNKNAWRIPHAVELGPNIVPQAWTISMTNDTGDYRLDGSIAGPDGAGNLARPFVSNSQQIRIEPELWRQGRVEKKDQPAEYGVAKGDTFSSTSPVRRRVG